MGLIDPLIDEEDWKWAQSALDFQSIKEKITKTIKDWKSPWEIEVEAKIAKLGLVGCVKRFFELLDKEEVSDNGRRFRPNYISSCRCLDGAELNKLIEKMKRLTNTIP